MTTPMDVQKVFDKQHANRWRISQSTPSERIAKLTRLRDAVLASRTELHQAIHEDFRKHPAETDLTEVYPVVGELNHAIAHLRDWMRPVRVPTPLALFGTVSEIRCEARGLVLILSPWNYPFNLSLNPVIAAVMAGNCVVLKPSGKVPATTRYIQKLIRGVFDESEVAVVDGGHDLSDALLDLPFDHVFFTGSPAIGKKVMAAASKHLATVTLEVGRKSPVVIDETANLRAAAERVMWGKFLNAGQTCVAPDYVLIHESVEQAFVKECEKVLNRRYGDTAEKRAKDENFCRLISVAHASHLKQTLDAAVAAGARIAIGGETDVAERYLAPTLVTDVTFDSPIMREEIFGPILPLLRFSTLDDALARIRGRDKPLALYVFSSRGGVIEKTLAQTTSGGVTINSTILHLVNAELPFGGVGLSGMGNYHGLFGFRALSHERAVLRQSKPDLIRFFYPPYTRLVRRMIDFFVKHLA